MSGECDKCGEHCVDCRCERANKINNSPMHKFLGNFWDWMHLNWMYASTYECCSSECDSFKEYVDKFLINQNSSFGTKE